MSVVRSYDFPDGISVVICTNAQGRVEPFLFERQEDAEKFGAWIQDSSENIDIALVYHGVTISNELSTNHIMGPGLRSVK